MLGRSQVINWGEGRKGGKLRAKSGDVKNGAGIRKKRRTKTSYWGGLPPPAAPIRKGKVVCGKSQVYRKIKGKRRGRLTSGYKKKARREANLRRRKENTGWRCETKSPDWCSIKGT